MGLLDIFRKRKYEDEYEYEEEDFDEEGLIYEQDNNEEDEIDDDEHEEQFLDEHLEEEDLDENEEHDFDEHEDDEHDEDDGQGDGEHEVDYNDESGVDEDYEGEYAEELYQERNRLNRNMKLKKFFNLFFIVIVLTVAIYFLFPILFGGTFGNKGMNQTKAEDIVTQMYTNNSVEQLITKNEEILANFEETLHSQLDVSNPDIYLARYAGFSDEQTEVTLTGTIEDTEGNVMVLFTVSNSFDLPSDRMIKFQFNKEGKVQQFEEYRLYPVVNN